MGTEDAFRGTALRREGAQDGITYAARNAAAASRVCRTARGRLLAALVVVVVLIVLAVLAVLVVLLAFVAILVRSGAIRRVR